MTKSVEKSAAEGSSSEGVPRLRVVEVDASTVGEASRKTTGLKAGEPQLAWVRSHPNQARNILQGDFIFFFPHASTYNPDTDSAFVQCVWWDADGTLHGTQEQPRANMNTGTWNDNYRIVIVDQA